MNNLRENYGFSQQELEVIYQKFKKFRKKKKKKKCERAMNSVAN